MDTPAVQYVTTPDGFRLAYAVAGAGEPIIHLPFHHNHVLLRWSSFPWFRGLAEHFRVLHYDSRGQGLSQHGLPDDHSFEAYRIDLETMVEASGFERFALVGYGGFGNIGLRYAIDHPERVSALVMICSSVSFKKWTRSVFLNLAEENWDAYLQLQTSNVPREVQPRVVESFKQMTIQSDYVKMIRCFLDSPDITDALPNVSMPTLLIHSLDQHWLPPAEGAKVASLIPDARIVFTEGGGFEPEYVTAIAAMVDFLKGIPPKDRINPNPSQREALGGPLSSRQLQVFRMLSEGKRTKEIADELVLSERTVERHIAGVYTKIGARNRSEATAFYLSRPDMIESGAKYSSAERAMKSPLV